MKEITSEVTKDELTNEIDNKDEELCDANEQTPNLDSVSNANEDSDNKNIKAESVEENKTVNSENDGNKDNVEKLETEITEDCVTAEVDDQDLKQEKVEIKPEPDEELCDFMEIDTRRSLRKRNTEVENESLKNNDVKEDSKANKDVKNNEYSLSRPAVAPQPSKSSTRWHLVCETLDDWINFAEWFKESQTKCERALSKVIREDFLPVLSEIIEARVSEYFYFIWLRS